MLGTLVSLRAGEVPIAVEYAQCRIEGRTEIGEIGVGFYESGGDWG